MSSGLLVDLDAVFTEVFANVHILPETKEEFADIFAEDSCEHYPECHSSEFAPATFGCDSDVAMVNDDSDSMGSLFGTDSDSEDQPIMRSKSVLCAKPKPKRKDDFDLQQFVKSHKVPKRAEAKIIEVKRKPLLADCDLESDFSDGGYMQAEIDTRSAHEKMSQELEALKADLYFAKKELAEACDLTFGLGAIKLKEEGSVRDQLRDEETGLRKSREQLQKMVAGMDSTVNIEEGELEDECTGMDAVERVKFFLKKEWTHFNCQMMKNKDAIGRFDATQRFADFCFVLFDKMEEAIRQPLMRWLHQWVRSNLLTQCGFDSVEDASKKETPVPRWDKIFRMEPLELETAEPKPKANPRKFPRVSIQTATTSQCSSDSSETN